MLAGPPDPGVDVPDAVSGIADGRPVRPVWENEIGGLTFEVGAGADRCFVKWAPGDDMGALQAEAVRMRWAAPFSKVPEVLGYARDSAGSWLVTTALPGESAVSDRWKGEPGVAVAAAGTGLRHLHDDAPADECPFTWSVARRLESARGRVARGETTPTRWHPEHRALESDEALAILATPPPVDRLVVCHGDACVPNTIVHEGEWSGHVDLGTLGVADRWADLAVATWSATWNFGPGWEQALLHAYGVGPDPERTAYYRLLWDLS